MTCFSDFETLFKNKNALEKCTNGCIFPFPKKGNFVIGKNYRSITLTNITPKIYDALLFKCNLKLRKFFRKIRTAFKEIAPQPHRFLEGVQTKNLRTTLLFIDFPKRFNSIYSRNIKAIVHSPHGDPEFLDLTSGVPQRDTLARHLLILCQNYVLWIPRDFIFKRTRIRWYPTEHVTDADYTYDLALLANTPEQNRIPTV